MFALNEQNRLTVYNGTEDKLSENEACGRLISKLCCDGGRISSGDKFCKFPDECAHVIEHHYRLLFGERFQVSDNNEASEDTVCWTPVSAEDALCKAIKVVNETTNLEELLGNGNLTLTSWDEEQLHVAVSLVRIFIQLNYTGPEISSTGLKEKLKELESKSLGPSQSAIQNFVEVDGIEVSSQVQQPFLLLLAEYFLSTMETDCSSWPFSLMWRFRIDFLRQRTLNRRSWSLCKRLKYLADNYINWATLPSHSMSGLMLDVHGAFLCEISEMLMFYYDGLLSENLLCEAMKVLNLSVEFSGKMGFRTKFQQTPKAQTVVNVVLEPGSVNLQEICRMYPTAENLIPRSEALNDETRLERLRLVDEESTTQTYRDVHQLVLLCKMLHRRDFQGNSELKLQEEEALINAILDCPVNWSGRIAALVARSAFEKYDLKSVDRSLRQLEEISKFITRRVKAEDEVFRQYLFFGSGHPTKAEIKMEFGEVLLLLNHWKEALKVYSELGAFDQIVRCYEMINMRHKAEELVREKIAECGKTPKLLVLLGDVTSDISFYEEAWTLSSHKSLDSQIRLGNFYFKREEFPAAMVHLKRVVELAPLEYPSWLRLAWAYYQTEDYDPAFQAYLRAANLEYDNFQVWNNLANCALKLKKKDYALRAYKVAVKCNYDEWRVWSNILLVASELGELTDSIHAYHRILDLNKSFMDEAVLERMVNIVTSSSNPTTLVVGSLAKLFGRITATSSRSTIVWLLYGRLLTTYLDCGDTDCDASVKATNFERAMHYYDKSLMLMRQNPSWKTDLDILQNVVKCIREFRERREHGQQILNKDSTKGLSSLDAMLRQTASSVHSHMSKLIEESLTPNERLQSIFQELDQERRNSFYA